MSSSNALLRHGKSVSDDYHHIFAWKGMVIGSIGSRNRIVIDKNGREITYLDMRKIRSEKVFQRLGKRFSHYAPCGATSYVSYKGQNISKGMHQFWISRNVVYGSLGSSRYVIISTDQAYRMTQYDKYMNLAMKAGSKAKRRKFLARARKYK